jgi:nucleoside-diphosphate-sugar epimerase
VALDEWPTLAAVGALAAQALHCRLWRTFPVPGPVCRFYGRCNDVLARLRRRPMLLSLDKMTEGLAGSWLCTADKAKRELGFLCQTGLAEGFRRTAAWYRAQGWL